MSGPADAGLARYLHDSADRRRLLAAMADGHARGKHGRELGGHTRGAYVRRVAVHLETAPVGLTVADPQGRPRYLLADPQNNQVAWITPHKEHRSTFFVPRNGARQYMREVAARVDGARPLDLKPLRTAERAVPRRITSARRGPHRGGPGRVP